jgi:Leucine-rich repeat (LRR) protein
MWNSSKLLWIDLSYNYLEKIEEEIVTSFPLLKTLYLHGNYIYNLDEVKKLGGLRHLHTLTLYGNSIE